MSRPNSAATSAFAGDLSTTLLDEARYVGLRVAQRLTDLDRVVEIAGTASEQSVQGFAWHDATYASGFAGLALLHQHACRIQGSTSLGEESREAWTQSLRRAAQETQQMPFDSLSIFSGATGLATALSAAVADEPRFLPSLNRLDENIAELASKWKQPRFERGTRFDAYDVISGPAGALLYVAPRSESNLRLSGLASDASMELVDLSRDIMDDLNDRLVLYPENYPLPYYEEFYPAGYVNLGLSHGIPGILLALSRVPGPLTTSRRQAIEALANRILAEKKPAGWSQGYVPASVAPDQRSDQHEHAHGASDAGHDAPLFGWCYGTPGVCLALRSAARCLGSQAIAAEADNAYEHALDQFLATPARKISPTVCHGLAGIVLVTTSFAEEGHEPSQAALPILLKELIEKYEAEHELGYRDQETPDNFVDDPGMLTGAAGVALTLLTLVGKPARGTWAPILGNG